MDPGAEFLTSGPLVQVARQLVAVAATVAIAMITGYLTGKMMKKGAPMAVKDEFEDGVWWEGGYFDCKEMEVEME
jgi:hypothetical protein